MFFRESFVDLDRRRYTGKEIRIQALGEKVEVGQICETERGTAAMLVEVVTCSSLAMSRPIHTTHMLVGFVP